MNTETKIDEVLSRGVAEVIGGEELKKRLLAGEKLRVKFGIDPTSPNIHLGRAVVLRKLRDFQDLGCEVHFIIGDFTGQIGDTSDKESERPMLSETLVENNLKTYLDQAYKILDKEKTREHRNSTWLSGLALKEIGELATWFSLHEFVSRDNIKKRLEEGRRVSLRELFYPLMQGYDSVMVDADIEIGGTDQRFNMLAGRTIQQYHMPSDSERKIIENNIKGVARHRSGEQSGDGVDPLRSDRQYILTSNLIPGTDGRKMSSSWGNTINLLDEPNEMFGKIMSIPDELIESYFVHCTRVPMEAVTEIMKAENPRDAKVRLAKEIVALYHGAEEAAKAEEYFVNTFSKGEIPEDIPDAKAEEGMRLVEFIVSIGFAESKGEARRKMEQGGVELDGEKTTDGNITLSSDHAGKVLKVGKKDFVKIVF